MIKSKITNNTLRSGMKSNYNDSSRTYGLEAKITESCSVIYRIRLKLAKQTKSTVVMW